jgi:signal transduction histidine kinase
MRAERFTAGRWLGLSVGVLAIAALVAIVAAFLAAESLGDARRRLADRVDPAQVAALQLQTALVNQETAVRGFLLGGQELFLEPDAGGRRDAERALAALERLSSIGPTDALAADIAAVRAQARAWREGFAAPAIAGVRAEGERGVSDRDIADGKARFDALREALRRMQANLGAAREDARDDLALAASRLTVALVFAAVVLLASLVAVALVARRVVALPIGRLTEQVRAVAGGALRRRIEPAGPKDVAALGVDVEAMRVRIVRELEAVQDAQAAIEAQAADLARSNAELEQFAYVASHDLQEPLRKVTSFCQMLERRYAGQLDERADQYIAFAVDGAKRMQILINDLLAFSRVGRMDREPELLDADDLVGAATANLASGIEETGADVVVDGDLPTVHGERSLLTLLFQNLIGNGIKFHGEETPRVRISAEREEDGFYRFTVADNGIGIDPEYSERIFIIFQRLHTKDAYAGTGIGLAMCRKVVEHHGGRIWLEPSQNGAGSTFRFTLPVPDPTPEEAPT